MRRTFVLLAAGAAAAAALAAPTAAAPSSLQITIRHQLHGCHAWSVDGGRYLPTQRLTTTPGTILTFADDDVMPHRLVQLAGPKVTLRTPDMRRMGATASLQLFAKGRYVFGTKPGEDYMSGVKTVGADNVLRLVVTVR